jgi:hypothetical protein
MELDWCAPVACSLPLADQPGRVAEWDRLFADAVSDVSPIEGGVRFVVDRTAARPAAVADLADRESQCCAFLCFALVIGDGTLRLDVTSGAVYADVVEALAARAASLVGSGR